MGRAVGTIDQEFQAAVAHHRAGDLPRAVGIYEEILRQEPRHAGAWHLLGVACFSRGDLPAALSHIERALSYCNTKAVYWSNYGAVLKE